MEEENRLTQVGVCLGDDDEATEMAFVSYEEIVQQYEQSKRNSFSLEYSFWFIAVSGEFTFFGRTDDAKIDSELPTERYQDLRIKWHLKRANERTSFRLISKKRIRRKVSPRKKRGQTKDLYGVDDPI